MLAEPPQELSHSERHFFLPVVAVATVTEANIRLFDI